MKRIVLTLISCFLLAGLAHAQALDSNIEDRLKQFFQQYETSYAHIGKCKLESFEVDHKHRTLKIFASKSFGYQPFTPENISSIYRLLKQYLPGPVNYYQLVIYADGKPIEDLIPNYLLKKKDKQKLWKRTYEGDAWVRNASRPFDISKGMDGRHLMLWQSHGKFYKNERKQWEWQRPRLFCTTEDLFTQSFVIPYLLPMLENAGAIVFTPRERDWQRHEVIVDNDGKGFYQEVGSRKSRWQTTSQPGFAQRRPWYTEGQNPFQEGTARFAPTERKAEKAFAQWIPTIPETGKYGVYVSYQSLPQSVTNAKYLVFHKGGVTEFKVNQRMGGGTWVYLGSFEFDRGQNDYGMVVLSNESNQQGVVCADAVRFGGGMGNIVREGKASGLPRYLEGARYSAQWAGMPAAVYSGKQGTNDYIDDINVRGRMANYLSGGSVYNPTERGLNIPFEMTLGLHSDAGYSNEQELIGSLGIYTTDFNESRLGAGISRYTSRDLADLVLTGLQRDLSNTCGKQWARRSLWNRNYSETRLPQIPSMILELLSHQNFADMKWGHDPHFKFQVARSIYKSLLRYTATMHHENYVVQPLPVSHFAVQPGKKKNTFELSWQGVEDPMEPTARPRGYVVYTRLGYGGWDNGTYVRNNEYTFKAEKELVYSFKVTAVNQGGESFPSEILSAYHAKKDRGRILIVNGFTRTSGPAIVESETYQGFDFAADPGIPYLHTPAYCGFQQCFDRKGAGKETPDGLGYSGNELEGILVAGNTFDYPFIHGKAIQQASGEHSFFSCSEKAVEQGFVQLKNYAVVDWIRGAQKTAFSQNMKEAIGRYCNQGGNLLLSGSYLGYAMNGPANSQFTENILKYTYGGTMRGLTQGSLYGAQRNLSIATQLNEKQYAVPAPDCLTPIGPAYSTFIYQPTRHSAGIAYKGNYRTFVLGFPFESITQATDRAHVMRAILNFFKSR